MKILVSGAGIAGSAAALFLHAGGHDVVVIDRAPAFARRGYILSLKYFGVKIMKSLGLWDDLRQSGALRSQGDHNQASSVVLSSLHRGAPPCES